MLTKSNTKDKISSYLRTRFGDSIPLQGAAPTPGLQSALKVKTLEESLLSCPPKKHKHTCRSHLTLGHIKTSIRNLFRGSMEMDGSVSRMEPILEVTEEFVEVGTFTCDCRSHVAFSTIDRRFYPVAPSDNPGCSGKGPAIALDGWIYETDPSQSLDDYESTRPPRKFKEDLKLTMMDRCERLKEHGASRQEMALFAKRVAQAKAKRAETVEAFSLYGKNHLARLEKRENLLRFLQQLFRLRQRESVEQAQLWEKAQKHAARTGPTLALTA